ncbi:MAG TPA: GyrI-like domain-containing protein [Natronosporangium sp.]
MKPEPPGTPEIVELPDQPYVGIGADVAMNELGGKLPPLLGELFGWLAARQLAPAGAPFFKYNTVDMDRELEVEVGIPVAAPVAGDDVVSAGVLPAGRYAQLFYIGHPDGLLEATRTLLAWGEQQGVRWDVEGEPQRWRARLEYYHTDPAEQPDMNQWRTELRFRLAD